MSETPLSDAVDTYLREVLVPFSTPGHKRNPRLVGDPLLLADAPHYGGADTLRGDWNVLGRAETLAASAFSADFCRFSHNGSTHSNQAICLATTKPNQPVLVVRTCHKSVYGGIILSGARPVWIAPEIDEDFGLALATRPESIAAALAAEPAIRTVILTEPSYVGVVSDIATIAEVCHAHGAALICDHAWAAHFGFASSVPKNALQLGADAMAVSLHKTLSSFTPGALLLARDTGRIDLDLLAGAFELLLTTSPSGTIYATMDRARAQIVEHGETLLANAVALATEVRERIGAIDGVRVVDDRVLAHPSVGARDPLKLVFDLTETRADGIAVERTMREHGVQLEGADRRTIVPQLTIGDDAARVEVLITELAAAIEQHRGSLSAVPPIATSWRSIPEQAMTPRDAFSAPRVRVSAAAAVGRVCGEFAAPYPPGIPALAPGEIVNAELWERLRAEAAAGTRIASASDPTLETLLVLS